MDNQINKILNDLYAIDPKLKSHEQELIKIINKLLISRPDTKFDASFAKNLRADLIAQAGVVKNSAPLSFRRRGAGGEVRSIFKLMFTKNYAYALGGLVIIVLLVASVFVFNSREGVIKLAFDSMEISQLENNAFGLLSSTQELNEGLPRETGAEIARSQAGGGGIGSAGLGGGGALAPSTLNDLSATTKEMSIMPVPEAINYNYIYKGEEFSVASNKMAVYKQLKNQAARQDLAKYISQVKTGLVDLNKFNNTSISNLNITEDQEFGYNIYLDLINNHISVNMNWEKWPQPEAKCTGETREELQKCYNEIRLKITDIPEDDAIIKIANSFIKEYGINMENYGPGRINDYWRQNYERTENKEMAYVPDTIPVVYPLLIDGQIAHDQSGNAYGLSVNVNIRYKKAAGLYNLRAQSFTSSNYDVVTDSQAIVSYAESGGLHKQWTNPNATKTVDIELGTPTLGLIMHYQYNQSKAENYELFVPAYIFPILNESVEGYFYQQSIVVPLVKELFAQGDDHIGIPRPEPMPMDDVKILEESEPGKEATVDSAETNE